MSPTGQLDWKIRQDPRVLVLERCNARQLTPAQLPEPIDLTVMDVSFISITKIIPALLPLFTRPFALLALIKPQFELPKEDIPRGGVGPSRGTSPEGHRPRHRLCPGPGPDV